MFGPRQGPGESGWPEAGGPGGWRLWAPPSPSGTETCFHTRGQWDKVNTHACVLSPHLPLPGAQGAECDQIHI